MGDIADAMLDGTLCEGCGTYMEGESEGFPRYCSDACEADRGAAAPPHRAPRAVLSGPNPNKTNCPTCKKRVKRAGLADHMRDAHFEGVPKP